MHIDLFSWGGGAGLRELEATHIVRKWPKSFKKSSWLLLTLDGSFLALDGSFLALVGSFLALDGSF